MYLHIMRSLTLLLLVGFATAAKIGKLPKNLKRCSWKLPSDELNECLRVAIEDGHKKLKDGDPSINVVKIEPLTVPEIRVGQGQGPVSINIIQRNVKIHGVSKGVQVRKFFSDFKNGVMGGEFFYPKLTLNADQTTDGRILLVPIKGTGKSTFTIQGYQSNFSTNFKVAEKNGYHYLNFDGKVFNYGIEVEKITFRVENLFGGDKTLGDATNQVINDNWKLLFTELRPIYEHTFKQLLIDALNKFFGKVPMEEVLLDFKQ